MAIKIALAERKEKRICPDIRSLPEEVRREGGE